MAVLYITEFARTGRGIDGSKMPVPEQPPVAEQTVAIGVSSTQSAAFNANTAFVRLSTDAICSVKFGTNPTATATSARMPAGSVMDFALDRSSPSVAALKLAVISNT